MAAFSESTRLLQSLRGNGYAILEAPFIVEEQVPRISSEEVSQQINNGQVPPDWAIFRPPKYPRVLLIMFGMYAFILWPIICTVGFGLVFW